MKAKLIVFLLVLLSFAVMLASCGEAGCEEGVHTLDEGVVTTASTCVKEGVRTYTCTLCGATVTKAEPKSEDHHYGVGNVTTEPTCNDDGVRTLTCVLCGKTDTKAEPATGAHVWGSYAVTKAPTCGVVGEKTRTCTTCGTASKAEVPATGLHKYDEGTMVTEATCSESGNKIRICQNEGCGDTYASIVPATGLHVAGTEYVVTDLVHYTPCQTCGLPMNEQAHVWDDGEVITPVVGCKSGLKRSTCTLCQHTADVTVESSQPHTSGCTIDAEHNKLVYACTKCGEGYTYTIVKLYDMEDEDDVCFPFQNSDGHDYDDESTIQSMIVEESEGSNKYQKVIVNGTLEKAMQVQYRGLLTISEPTFVFSFDIMSPSATNDASFGIQFFNTDGTWDTGRGLRFLELSGNTLKTTKGLNLATLSTEAWTNVRIEVRVTDSAIDVQYFINNTLIGTETLSNSMYEKTVKSVYMSDSWQTEGSGYYFDNILMATK